MSTGTSLAAPARIACQDLVVRAGGRVVLDVPCLDVPTGETLAVLGPNGSGKSTLLRALAMLPQDRSGSVVLDGEAVGRREVRPAVAAVLQRPVVQRGSVRHNVAAALLLRGRSRAAAHRLSDPWMLRLGVDHLAERDARSLSGGERQRVALARALAVGPRVLLLDEPFAGLDATTRSDLVADLRDVFDDADMATVLVTHDRDEAAALAGRTGLLVAGTLRQVGPTTGVLDHPADVDCARLVGYVDVLAPALTGLARTVVARPEHAVAVAPGAPAPDDAVVVEARLVRTVPLGGITRVDVVAGPTAGEPEVPLSCLVAGDAPQAVRALPVGAALHVAVRRRQLRELRT